jgi:hypothetical protein
VVFRDGTLALGYSFWSGMPTERPRVQIVLSDDGGQTLRKATPTGPSSSDRSSHIGNFWFGPQMTTDSSSTAYRDRLYVVWEDGNGPDGQCILFAFSQDKGKTWVGPTILSEQPAEAKADYSAYMPTIAVNKDGAVAVTWCDRRGLPDVASKVYGCVCASRLTAARPGNPAFK